ncbi:CREB/ATF bZIP transcription factor [Rhineura floridana]|uniref:CREB/ATF bZIP transcription factor n=1 Tax=Rhineura floridana TaxID=261503 RepID=UPI002AC88FEA|nr:CREB/ATF bZIP transcription factor [Rhineura floridana]
MRHSLAQLLATSSGRGSPSEPSAACSLPSEGTSVRSGRGNAAEAGGEAEPRHEEAAADSLEEPDNELLFPAGLELDDWLEAAVVAETRPDWEINFDGDRSPSPKTESESPTGSRPARPGSNRLKAAAAARLNRQKKKQYVMGLESRLQGLAAENRHLRDRNRGLCRRLRDLERETSYLRAVLANQSALGRLLSHLAGEGGAARVGLRISSSLFEDHPVVATALETPFPCDSSSGGSSDHDYALPVPQLEDYKRAISSSPGGICLHVDRDQVSVEFCSVCATRAASSAFAAESPSPSFASKIFSFRCLPCQAPLCRG